MQARGATNIGDALSKSLSELKARGRSNTAKAIVFLTDGHITTGMNEEQVLSGPVQEAIDKKIPIYAIGYGDPSYLREDFLRKMATNTGGKYYYATEAFQLQNTFIRSALEGGGWRVLGTFGGKIRQGETKSVGTFDVQKYVKRLRIILNWPGSNLDLKLVNPRGMEIDRTAPSVDWSGDTKPEYAIITNPDYGTWTAKVYGKDVGSSSTGETSYFVVAATSGTVEEASSWLQIVVLVCIIAGVSVSPLAVVSSRKSRRPSRMGAGRPAYILSARSIRECPICHHIASYNRSNGKWYCSRCRRDIG